MKRITDVHRFVQTFVSKCTSYEKVITIEIQVYDKR